MTLRILTQVPGRMQVPFTEMGKTWQRRSLVGKTESSIFDILILNQLSKWKCQEGCQLNKLELRREEIQGYEHTDDLYKFWTDQGNLGSVVSQAGE